MVTKHCRLMFLYQSRLKKIMILLQIVLYATLICLASRYRSQILSRFMQYCSEGIVIVYFGLIVLLCILGAMSVADKIQKQFSNAASAFYHIAGITRIQLLVIQAIYCFLDLAFLSGIAAIVISFLWDTLFARIACIVLFPLLSFGGGCVLSNWQASKRTAAKQSRYIDFTNRLVKQNVLAAYAVRAFSSSQFLGFAVFYIVTLGFGFMIRIPLIVVFYGLATLSMLPAFALYEREEREAEFLCWMKISKRRIGILIAVTTVLTVFLLFIAVMLLWSITAHGTWLEGLLALCVGGISLVLAQLLLCLLIAPLLPDRVSAPYVSPLLLMTMVLSFIPLMKPILLCVFLRRRKTLADNIAYQEN